MPWSRLRSAWSRWLQPPGAGVLGEQAAEMYLRTECGFRSLARNWRNPADQREEIDLVMRDEEVLVFVEVKARSTHALVPGYHAVTARKKRVLRRACLAYLCQLRPRPQTFRFDIVEVELPATAAARPIIRHFAHVPLFGKNLRY